MNADKHPQEQARLDALKRYEILDSDAEADFDEIVRVVSLICDMPVSLISLVDTDRQWFKAKSGVDLSETPLEMSVCAHGILQPDLLEIRDLTKDFRTIDNPLVKGAPHARYYAGAALTTDDGLPIGMLCVLDFKPRQLTEPQRDMLQVMARMVMRLIEARRLLKAERLAHTMVQEILEKANALLARNDTLRREIDHRVKNSLALVVGYLRIQERSFRDEPRVAGPLADARNRVLTVVNVHDQLHRSVEDDHAQVAQFLNDLCHAISQNRPAHVAPVEVEADATHLPSEKLMPLGLAVNELVSNALKHAFPHGQDGKVRVTFHSRGGRGVLTVSDNGVGISPAFDAAASKGLGLKLLTGLAQQLGGTLAQETSPGGTGFSISFALADPE